MASRPARILASTAILALVIAGSAIAAADAMSSSSQTVTACKTSKGLLTLASPKGHCAKGQRGVKINQQGPRGSTGPTGKTGHPGPAGSLKSTPFFFTFDHTSNASNTITTPEGTAVDLECGDGAISTAKATVDIDATEGHGTYVESYYPANGTPSTTTYQRDWTISDRSSRAEADNLGDYATVSFAGFVHAPNGDMDDISIWFSRDTRQGHPVCTFEGTIVDTGRVTVSAGS